jgi:hypothetical protein
MCASRPGPARPRAIACEEAGGYVIASRERQENFSHTCAITFHWRGINSRVSVTSSPSLCKTLPQHEQADGAGWTTRSRGRCSGNGRRAGRLRSKLSTLVFVLAAAATWDLRPASDASSSVSASRSSSCSRRGAAFGGLTEPLVAQLGDGELHLLDQQRTRLRLGALGKQHRLERLDVVGKGVGAGHESNCSTARAICDRQSRHRVTMPHQASTNAQPAACGRHVCCGIRQSMPSRI